MSKRKPYQREVQSTWWLKSKFYTLYMIREGSSIFITLYSLILAWGILRLSQGEAAFDAWLSALQHPVFILLHLITLILALYHSITWFSLAPKAVDLYIKGKPLADKVIITGHYIGFIVISLLCLVIIML